jgi:hypothetical protein
VLKKFRKLPNVRLLIGALLLFSVANETGTIDVLDSSQNLSLTFILQTVQNNLHEFTVQPFSGAAFEEKGIIYFHRRGSATTCLTSHCSGNSIHEFAGVSNTLGRF